MPFWYLGGLLLGYAYFRALRSSIDLIMRGGSMGLALTLRLGRLALLGVSFYVAVSFGALALLAAFVGVLSAKGVMLLAPALPGEGVERS